MPKRKSRYQRNRRDKFTSLSSVPIQEKFRHERNPPPIRPLNENQASYLQALRSYEQIFVLGPAGTGKTWLAASHAADRLRSHKINKIIITRPNVPCGRTLGHFPGDLNEKFAPWAAPVIEAIKGRMGRNAFEIALKHEDIEMVPFEVMRGRSFHDAFVLLDEAQNATPEEIKVFLTRIGERCTTVINGDITQCDLADSSGLAVALDMIRDQQMPVPIIEFTADDIVRGGVCGMWVRAFEKTNP